MRHFWRTLLLTVLLVVNTLWVPWHVGVNNLWSVNAAKIEFAASQETSLPAGPPDHLRQASWQAKRLLRQELTSEAVLLLSAWLHEHPNDVFAHAVLGDAWYASGMWEPAAKEWQQAGNLKSLIKYGWDAQGKGQWTKAIALFRAASELSPQAGALELAIALNSNQETAQAEAVVRAALDTPLAVAKRVDLVLVLAEIVANDGRWKESLALYQEALTMDPMNAQAFVGSGKALYHTGNLDAAIASLQKGITQAPESAKGYEVLADIYSELQRYAEADKLYWQAIELSPSTQWLLIRRGNNALAARDYATAIECYEAALQRDEGALDAKQNASVYRNLGLAYEEVGDYVRASKAKQNARIADIDDK